MLFNIRKKYRIQKTIVLIEDNQTDAAYIKNWLKKKGFNVYAAETAEKGIDLVNRVKPDLVFTDYNLPSMDGAKICSSITTATETCDIPVIILTALDSPVTIIKSFESGAYDYITKPYLINQIGRQLKIVLKSYNMM